MIEYQFRGLFQEEPLGMIIVAELFFILMYINECEVSYAQGTLDGVAERVPKGLKLLHINPFQTGEFLEDTVGCLVEAFLGLKKTSHQAPFASFWFQPSLDQE